jgi:hypothetical protein
MDPVVIDELRQADTLARHVGDFLTNLASAGASGHTLRTTPATWPSSLRK